MPIVSHPQGALKGESLPTVTRSSRRFHGDAEFDLEVLPCAGQQQILDSRETLAICFAKQNSKKISVSPCLLQISVFSAAGLSLTEHMAANETLYQTERIRYTSGKQTETKE